MKTNIYKIPELKCWHWIVVKQIDANTTVEYCGYTLTRKQADAQVRKYKEWVP